MSWVFIDAPHRTGRASVEAMSAVYRTMMAEPSGQPECACERNKLGATPADITPDGAGVVGPSKKGMSVNANPAKLPAPLRPERFAGGSSRLPLFSIESEALGAELELAPASPKAHAVVQPTREMHILDYQQALWRTQPSWRKI